MENENLPRFIAKWGRPCPWCSADIVPGDEASFDFEDRLVHYGCRLVVQR